MSVLLVILGGLVGLAVLGFFAQAFGFLLGFLWGFVRLLKGKPL